MMQGGVSFFVLVLCFPSIWALDSECSYRKNDLDVYHNDSSVNIQCVWGSAGSADGSGGYIFGVIIPFPSKCGVKSQRILTVSTENEVKCLKHTGYEGLCKFALKNASLETTSDGSKITSVQVLVPWLFNFSMTTNNTFFWMPYKTGIGNMSQCITDVHISNGELPAERNNTNTTVGPTTLPESTQVFVDGEGPEEENTNTTVGPTTLPKSTQSNKGALIIVGCVIGLVVVVGIVICLRCYRSRKRRSLQDQEGRKQNLESSSIELTSEAAEEGFDRTREVE